MNPWQSPSLGYTREFNHALVQTLEAWFHSQQASFDYQLVLLEIWLKTIEEFLQMLLSLTERGETVQHWQQALRLWSEIFDRTFAQTFQSEQSLQKRGKTLKTALEFRKHQKKLLDTFLKWNDLPSRSEVDEIHHSVYELRKEIKSLKKAFVESQKHADDKL
jgi:class III poly(R)-hydroxyalkanoic acid synthase PhaE subunit